MFMLDIFNADPLTVTGMTYAMREISYAPSRISQLGLFQVESIDTQNQVQRWIADDVSCNQKQDSVRR